jgi:hypothetical protein
MDIVPDVDHPLVDDHVVPEVIDSPSLNNTKPEQTSKVLSRLHLIDEEQKFRYSPPPFPSIFCTLQLMVLLHVPSCLLACSLTWHGISFHCWKQNYSQELSNYINEKWTLKDAGFNYNLAAIFGSQSTGKSKLLPLFSPSRPYPLPLLSFYSSLYPCPLCSLGLTLFLSLYYYITPKNYWGPGLSADSILSIFLFFFCCVQRTKVKRGLGRFFYFYFCWRYHHNC